MMKYKVISILTLSALLGMSCQAFTKDELSNTKTNHWLLDAQNEQQKTLRLEKYLRGFDQPMLEVGQRYQSLFQALKDDNFDLAIYQWKKIKTTIENGVMKRPARRKNAELILLNNTWQQVMNDFKSRDSKQAWIGLEKAKGACMACHAAEGMPFMNNQPLFKLKK